MEFIVVMLAGCVLAIPVIAIVALVRTGRLRDSLDEHFTDQMNRVRDLEVQVSSLRRDLSQMQAAKEPEAVAVAPPTPEVRRTTAASAPSPLPEESARPSPATEPVKIAAMSPTSLPVAVHSVPPPIAAFQTPSAAQPIQMLSPTEASKSASPPQPEPSKLTTQIPAASSLEPIPSPPRPVSSPSQPVTATNPQFASASAPYFTAQYETATPRKTIVERLRTALPLEEVLGMNLFAKIGIVLLVLGFALLGRVALVSMGNGERVALIYAVAGVMLGGGIWLERKDRYRLIGRTGIGGGWALLFFTTYAMHYVSPMMVLHSNTLDCILMLVVAVAMVGHTLRYNSQLVTGLAFLLAFSTVALSQDTVYSLAAGVILAVGIIAIALRMSWFELEIFGIIASYANHFYWLYKLYPDGVAGHPFPQFWPSAILLILYWGVFRISYIVRRIRTPRDETISTMAALLNSVLLLAVMRFQSTRPELAFYALLALGAIEFFFGQLPITRRRRPAFILLTVLGTILVFASVPFKFSGNNIALLWMIAAEVLLIAGIVQLEVVFRRLGLLGSAVTGLLILYGARGIVELRQTSQAPLIRDGILLLTCGILFYFNAHFLRPKWERLFSGMDRALMTGQSYLGAVTAFLGVWAIFTGDWTAVGWAALMLAAAYGKRYLDDNHLMIQGWAFAGSVLIAAYIQNSHLSDSYPHHILARLVTLPILAFAFYFMAWILSGVNDVRVPLRTLSLWSGSVLLTSLAWLDIKQTWVALVWVMFAVVLSSVGRRLRIADLTYQEHCLALFAIGQLTVWNFDAHTWFERYIPLAGCAVAFYAISRFCAFPEASYGKAAAWAHTWAATALLAALAWHESPQPWLAAIWAVFALGLALADRFFDVEELPWQAHVLALLAVIRAVTLNLYSVEKWHGRDLRLITVSILVGVLYALARWVRMPASLESSDTRHAYTWAASGLFAWMLWSKLQPISVALGLAVFGLALFEWGHWRNLKQIRLQGYAALIAAFVRIFFVNLTAATLPGEMISPRIYTVAPIALIYFFVWAQLQSKKVSPESSRWSATDLIAYLGTASVAALLYFQVPAEWIIFAWAITVLVLMTASLLLDKEIFLHQSELLVVGIVTRALAHNIFGGSYFVAGGWNGNIGILSLTAGLLLLALPISFSLRARYAVLPPPSPLVRKLALRHPEQILFFAPLVLISFMIAVKMNPGMVTLSWGVEGVMVILLGLLVSQRTYRITGLSLLLLCVAKIVVRDAWHLGERDRYITFIVLGSALTLVSALYGKYRETVRRLL
jgi:uncharacterized membrane protein